MQSINRCLIRLGGKMYEIFSINCLLRQKNVKINWKTVYIL